MLNPEDYEIKLAKFSNPNVLGMAVDVKDKERNLEDDSVANIASFKKPVVLIGKNAFNNGKFMVAAVLWEEMVHHEYGVKDKTRAMQTKLIELMIVYAQRLNCLPL